ncbi:MAG: HEPN domain-containing protein [Abditibacteriaceae bacterium]
MKIDQKIVTKFEELIEDGERLIKTRASRSGEGVIWIGDDAVNSKDSHEWGIKSLNLLSRVFRKESDHYKRFDELFTKFDDFTPVLNAQGILKGAKNDYENGYLFEARTLIQAEVFDDFLEQAEYLLQGGYYHAAAVIAGSILEDGLRQLCIRNNIDIPEKPKMDSMNSLLTKENVYNLLAQKQITALADLRNKAAHGQYDEFTKEDVKQMILQVRSFMATHFS